MEITIKCMYQATNMQGFTPKLCDVLDYQLCTDVGHVAAHTYIIQAAEKYKFSQVPYILSSLVGT